MYTHEEYSGYYRQLKQAEKEVETWILKNTLAEIPAGENMYFKLGVLAKQLSQKRVLPEDLRAGLVLALENRIKLTAHHKEKGDADLGHQFPIELFKNIATSLFPLPEISSVVKLVADANVITVASTLASPCYSSSAARGVKTPSPSKANAMAAPSWRSRSTENIREASNASWMPRRRSL